MPKKAVVTASELQRASGKVLKRVALGQEHLVVERAGYPVAVMLSYAEYELLVRAQASLSHQDLVPPLERAIDQQAMADMQVTDDLEGGQLRAGLEQ